MRHERAGTGNTIAQLGQARLTGNQAKRLRAEEAFAGVAEELA